MQTVFTLFGELNMDTAKFRAAMDFADNRMKASEKSFSDSEKRREDSLTKTALLEQKLAAQSEQLQQKLSASANALNQRTAVQREQIAQRSAAVSDRLAQQSSQFETKMSAATQKAKEANDLRAEQIANNLSVQRQRLAQQSAQFEERMAVQAANKFEAEEKRKIAASERAAKASQASWGQLGGSMQQIGTGLTVAITAPLVAGAVASVKFATEFEQQMTYVRTQAGDTTDNIGQLSTQVLELAKHSQFGPDKLAEGLYHLASLGLRGAEAMNALNTAQQMAAVGGADLESTASALGAAIVTGIKGTQDYSAAAGTLNAIIGAGNMRMNDLVAAMGTGVLPVFKMAGLSLQDFGAALATMTDNGMGADEAATRLRMTISLMEAPSRKAQGALAAIGMTSEQLGMDLRQKGLIPALQDLKKHLLDTYGSTEAGQNKAARALTEMFGGGRSSGAIKLLVDQLDRARQKFDQIGEQSGRFNTAVAEQAATASAKIKTAWSVLQAIGIDIGQRLLPYVAIGFSAVTDAIITVYDWFNKLSPAGQAVGGVLAAIAAAIGPIIAVIGTLIVAVGTVVTAVTAISGIVASAGGWAAAIGIVAGVLAGIATLMATVGVAVTELYLVWTTDFGGIRSFMLDVWNGIQAMTSSAMTAIKSLWSQHGSTIMSYAKEIWSGISTIFRSALTILDNVIRLGLDIIRGNWSGAWNDVLAIVKEATHLGVASMVSFASNLKSVFATIIPEIIRWGVVFGFELERVLRQAVIGAVGILVTLPVQLIKIVPRMIAAGVSIGKAIREGVVEGLAGGLTGAADQSGETEPAGRVTGKTTLYSLMNDLKGHIAGAVIDDQGGAQSLLDKFTKAGDTGESSFGKLGRAAKGASNDIKEVKISIESLLDAMRRGVSSQESGGKSITNADSGATGMFQVMPGNIPAWTQEILGKTMSPEAFKKDSVAQIAVFKAKMGEYLKKSIVIANGDWQKAVRIAAAMWYGNPATAASTYNDTTPQYSNGHRYPSKNAYGLSVLGKVTNALGDGGKMRGTFDLDPMADEAASKAREVAAASVKLLSDAWGQYIEVLKPAKTAQEQVNEALKDPKALAAVATRTKLTEDQVKVMLKAAAAFADFAKIDWFMGTSPNGSGRDMSETFPVSHGLPSEEVPAFELPGVKKTSNDPSLDLGTPPKLKLAWENFWMTLRQRMDTFKASLPSVKQAIGENLMNGLSRIGDVFANAAANWDGTAKGFFKSLASGFKSLISSILAEITRLMVAKVVAMAIQMVGSLFGGGGGMTAASHNVGSIGHAEGGLINGPGTGTSDSILARLSNGEFVVRAAAVRQWGSGFFERLNSGFSMPQMAFAGGGLVGGGSGSVYNSSNSSMNQTFNIHVSGGGNQQQTVTSVRQGIRDAIRMQQREAQRSK